MTGISAIIITLNEERNIGRCIASLKEITDEIIVVDSHSNDNTRQIAEASGAMVFEWDWEGYAKTKNLANMLASYEYVLSVDADEALSPELTASIIAVKKKGLTGVYEFNRLANYCGKWVWHSGWYPDRKIRLFPKAGAQWEGDFVHEILRINNGLSKTRLKGNLLHYTYYTTEEHRNRIEKYTDLHAKKLLSKGTKPTLLVEWLAPPFKFFQTWVLRLGFLDGMAGWRIAFFSAMAVKLKYKKLRNAAKVHHS